MKKIIIFEDWLREFHIKENPEILDDDLPDAFDKWICEIDTDRWVYLGQMYGEHICFEFKNGLEG